MQTVLRFDTEPADEHVAKRRKNARACERCQHAKKRCTVTPSVHAHTAACERCTQDRRHCSFASQLPSPASIPNSAADDFVSADDNGTPAHVDNDPGLDGSSSPGAGADAGQWQPDAGQWRTGRASTELRYSTMLDILHDNPRPGQTHDHTATKLIGDTNPLSALLRKDLKHRIVTNLCAFRTPDPLLGAQRPPVRRLQSTDLWDWESYYASSCIAPAKYEYIRALGCFKLPGSQQSGQLLNVYFTHIHPMLPIIDRRDFLARYYGTGDPPPLVTLLAVFLAAARYCASAFDPVVVDGHESVRDICDLLHTRLRALIDVDILSERIAVLQASMLGSLHWEGREGINSSLDALGIAVRIAQEMGLHRQRFSDTGSMNVPLHRRIWWCIFALDRFTAATEGTPFIVNEMDCDLTPLCEADFVDEDTVVRDVAFANCKLARIVNDAVRSLYSLDAKPEILHSRYGEVQRDRLTNDLDRLESRLASLQSHSTLLRVHTYAVRLLVHRPFLLHQDSALDETADILASYKSRQLCRIWASQVVTCLESVRYTWPFTVYALVNSLLIFWYDFTAPQEHYHKIEARKFLEFIVKLLDQMGNTWWAAAAKHKLAEALLRIGDRLHKRTRLHSETEDGVGPSHPTAGLQLTTPSSYPCEDGSFGLQRSYTTETGYPTTATTDEFSAISNEADFWPLLGLDFETELAQGIYSIA